MKKRQKKKAPIMPRMGAAASCFVTRRKAGPMKHKNTARGGSKRIDHNEGWES